MDQDRPWSRGRSGWGNEGLGLREGAEGRSQSPRRNFHPGSQSQKYMPNRPAWDDTVQDLASMRLTPAELARKLASRQSSNIVLARAQLLEQSRRPGSHNPNLPPALAARLQAARQQSVDSVLAQSNAMLLASQKMRQSELAQQEQDTAQRPQDPDGQEDKIIVETLKQETSSGRTTPQPKELLTSSETERASYSTLRKSPSPAHSKSAGEDKAVLSSSRDSSGRSSLQNTPKHSNSPQKPARRYSADGAATRTSLDHTITMVVNTCRELWQQLQEERVTREHLQQQLHQQGNVITSLTSELLQIQDQQEAILLEVSDARASGLWGGETQLNDRPEDIPPGQTMSGFPGGVGRPSPQMVSGRHPQRSILRATRTIHQPHAHQPHGHQPHAQPHGHQPHSRQPPTYQSHHQSRSYAPSLPYHAPHSPRPHQPSPGSRDSSPPLGVPLMRNEAGSNNYGNTISRKIRDALASGQNPYASELSKTQSQLKKDKQMASSQDIPDKDRIVIEQQSVPSSQKDNALSHIDGNVMELTNSMADTKDK